jgi:hypothetical protein
VPQLQLEGSHDFVSCGAPREETLVGTLGSQSTETVCEQTAISGPRVPISCLYSTRLLQQVCPHTTYSALRVARHFMEPTLNLPFSFAFCPVQYELS